MKKSGNSNYLTFINVVSAISVLILHTNGCFWSFSATELYWKTANVIESIFYFAVPCFFMISGITLMDFYDRYTLKVYFRRRFVKVGIPFLAWSMIGLAEKIIIKRISLHEIDLKYLYQGIVGTSIVGIYWFFTPLFILYLCIPLFAAVDKDKRKNVFTYLVSIGFVLNILFPFLKDVLHSDFMLPYNITVISGVLIWPPLGWLLHQCELNRESKAAIFGLAICGLLMHIIGTYTLSIKEGTIISTYKGYQNVPSVLYAAGIFVFLKDIGIRVMKHGKLNSFISCLGEYSFSIYLIQFVLLDAAPHFISDTKSILYRLGAPFVMIPIIIAVTWCMRKIPIIRKIVP